MRTSLSIASDSASLMHTKDLTDISNFPSKNSVPEIHKAGGVWYSLNTPGQVETTSSSLVLTTSLTQVLSYGNDAFFTQHDAW